MANWHVPGYIKSTGKISKIAIFGQKGCGKTSILEQAIYGNSDRSTIYPTIEDVYPAQIESDRGIKEKARFYDTEGLEPKCREIPKHYLSFCDGIILVYSINDQDSFTTVDYIKTDINRNKDKREITIIVLANKKDLEVNRVVEQNIAQAWANGEKVKLFEVSVSDRSSLMEPLVHLISKLNPPPSKSTFPQLRKTKLGNSTGEV